MANGDFMSYSNRVVRIIRLQNRSSWPTTKASRTAKDRMYFSIFLPIAPKWCFSFDFGFAIFEWHLKNISFAIYNGRLSSNVLSLQNMFLQGKPMGRLHPTLERNVHNFDNTQDILLVVYRSPIVHFRRSSVVVAYDFTPRCQLRRIFRPLTLRLSKLFPQFTRCLTRGKMSITS